MNKNSKIIEKRITRALNDVCDSMIVDIAGFCWLTHFVDHARVLQSLCIVCVFDTDLTLMKVKDKEVTQTISNLVLTHLVKEGFDIPQIEKRVFFDTEEKGADINESAWCRKYSNKV